MVSTSTVTTPAPWAVSAGMPASAGAASATGSSTGFGFIDRAEGAEELQALAGRSFADFQTLNDRRETEGLIRSVEQPVDLADRLWYPKQLHDLRKKSHALAFKCDGNRC